MNHEQHSDPGEPANNQWLHRSNGVDLLEIYHARQLRAQIIEQLRRLAEQADQPGTPGLCAGELGVFYESLLMNVEHLLSALGDGSTSECWT
ncbi:MAG: hypothetical protein ACR2PZ_02890 [Pseudomonadales bacterium]